MADARPIFGLFSMRRNDAGGKDGENPTPSTVEPLKSVTVPVTSGACDPACTTRALLVPELAEVCLLLDYVSSCPQRILPKLGEVEPFTTDRRGWVDQVCAIRLPSGVPVLVEAQNASALLQAKDQLTRTAHPATGFSIAFSLMLAGGSARKRRPEHESTIDPWTALRRTVGASIAGADLVGEKEASTPAWRDRLGEDCSRERLARVAFPLMARNMRYSRAFYYFLNCFLAVTLVFTCWLSWQVATGVALLHRVDRFAQEERVLTGGITRAALLPPATPPTPPTPPATGTTPSTGIPPVRPGGTSGVPGTTTTPQTGTTQDAGAESTRLAAAAEAAKAASAMIATDPDRPIARANLMRWVDENYWLAQMIGGGSQTSRYGIADGACDVRQVAIDRTEPWYRRSDFWPHLIRTCPAFQPRPAQQASQSAQQGGTIGPQATPTTPAGADPNVEWAGVMIGVLAVTVLPICYGVLGSAAAVVRKVASKLQDSTLLHRDLVLGMTHLALGALVGACVGLFVSPKAGASSGDGLFGDVSLSAAALCFLAGFAVDQVFRALESFAERAFPDRRETPPVPQQAPAPTE